MTDSHPADSRFNYELNLERIVFFSDAVMAIAITLMALELRLPELHSRISTSEFLQYMHDLAPRIGTFLSSFFAIAIYWNSHHRVFGYIKRYDGRLILLNMLFLLCVVLLPFTTNMIGSLIYLPLIVAIYSFNLTASGLTMLAIVWYAMHDRRLVSPDLEPWVMRERLARILSACLVFLIAIPAAFVSPNLAALLWWLAPVLSTWLSAREVRRARQTAEDAEPPRPAHETPA